MDSAQFENSEDDIEVSPLANFMFALNAPETQRQYPKRLEVS